MTCLYFRNEIRLRVYLTSSAAIVQRRLHISSEPQVTERKPPNEPVNSRAEADKAGNKRAASSESPEDGADISAATRPCEY